MSWLSGIANVAKTSRNSVSRKLTSFQTGCHGNAAVTFAIASLPVMLMTGAGIDYGRTVSYREAVRAALDSAVLAGAGASAATRDAVATAQFDATIASSGYGSYSNLAFSGDSKSYSGTVQGSVPLTIMALTGLGDTTFSLSSTAGVGSTSQASPQAGMCMIALNATVANAFSDSGGTNVSADCIVQVNSSNAKAVSFSGSANLTSKENCFVGSAVTSGGAKITPAQDATCAAVDDPFASVTKPTVSSCDYSSFKKSNYVGTVSPGTYCGGMSFSNGTVTFSPGLYIIQDGTLSTSGSAQLSGNGVTFYFTGSKTGINFSGGTGVNFVASSSGPLPGFIFFLDSSGSPNKSSQLSGGSTLYYEGVIYMPGQQIGLSGQSSGSSISPYTAYIADTFTFSGQSNLTINADPSQTNVPIPSALVTSSSTTQTRLTQ